MIYRRHSEARQEDALHLLRALNDLELPFSLDLDTVDNRLTVRDGQAENSHDIFELSLGIGLGCMLGLEIAIDDSLADKLSDILAKSLNDSFSAEWRRTQ